MRIGFTGPSYTARSTAVADEECINFFAETMESQGSIAPSKSYGGSTAAGMRNYYGTPGLSVFTTLAGVSRGSCWTGSRRFFVGGSQLVEVSSTGVQTVRGTVSNDGTPVSFSFSAVQLLICSAGRAYCFDLTTLALTDVTASLVGVPVKVRYSDGYFIVNFQNSNKFQISAILDGTTWPPIQVNEVSVFPDGIVSIEVNHRELWVLGQLHSQVYTDTGSLEVFDVIPGVLIEHGCGAAFSTCLMDNSVFWVGQDERGGRDCWRSNGYTPVRVSTYAVETDLDSYASIADLVSYSYQDAGHLFWILYIPGSQWSWVYDVKESMWHKRASWNGVQFGPHWSWNHIYDGMNHLVGDWNSNNVYIMSMANLDDNGTAIRSLRRSPTVTQEMVRIYASQLILDWDTGLGPQPPLLDGSGNPREPQCMLRWSDDRGKTWSNIHTLNLGFAGQYRRRAIQRRIGQSRYRVWELSITDKIPRILVDAYLKMPGEPI